MVPPASDPIRLPWQPPELRHPAESGARAAPGDPSLAGAAARNGASVATPGVPLPPGLAGRFSAAYGHDLSGVRVHAESAEAASLGVRAFTTGRDVAFAPGQYQPGTPDGDHLIAHELAHVVQQSGAAGAPAAAQFAGGERGGALEDEADHAAVSALAGQTAKVSAGAARAGGQAEDRAPQSSRVAAAIRAIQLARQHLFGQPRDEGRAIRYLELAQKFMDVVATDLSIDSLRGQPGFADSSIRLRNARGAPKALLALIRSGYPITEKKFDGYLGDMVTARSLLDTLAGDIPLAGSRQAVRAALEKEWAARGGKGVAALVERVERERWTAAPSASRTEQLAVVREELTKLQAENGAFAAAFGVKIDQRLRQILAASKAEITGQLEALGIEEHVEESTYDSAGGRTRTVKTTTYSIDQQNKEAAELARFAALLAEKQAAIEKVRKEGPHAPAGGTIPAARSPADASVQDLTKLITEYNLLRAAARRRFPVLAALDSDPDALARLGVGATPQMAAAVGTTAREKLDAIARVSEALASGDLSPWQLPVIVEGAKRELGVLPRTMHDRVVGDTAREVAADKAAVGQWISTVAFALGLIAMIPTGGASVGFAAVTTAAAVGSTALTVAHLLRDLSSYTLAQAENNTHFDRAMAISQDEPSLFWLAFEIAGVILSGTVARSAFLRLRAALAARRIGKEALEEFARIAREVLPEESARRVIATAEKEVAAGLTITGKLPLAGAVLSEVERARIGLALAKYAEEAYTRAFLELSELGRVRPLTRQALIEAYGEEKAAPMLKQYFETPGFKAGGFHDARGFPPAKGDLVVVHKGIVFISGDATLAGVAGKVVHELTHNFQALYWESLYAQWEFNLELMAHRAQQTLLQRVAADAGLAAIPGESRWLLEANEETLRREILTRYAGKIVPAEGWGKAFQQSGQPIDKLGSFAESPGVVQGLPPTARMPLSDIDEKLGDLIRSKLDAKTASQRVLEALEKRAAGKGPPAGGKP